jgi:hypothetical protein
LNSGKPIYVVSVIVRASQTDEVVWDINSFDLKLFYEKRGDRVYPRKDGISNDQISAVNLARLVFGTVPAGFVQYYPPSRAHPLSEDARLKKYYPMTEETKPILKHNTRYVITVGSGSGSGSTEFMLDKECRKISLTPYSKNNPAFSTENKCD